MIRLQRERTLEARHRVFEIADVLGVVIGVMRKTDVLHSFLEAGFGVAHGR